MKKIILALFALLVSSCACAADLWSAPDLSDLWQGRSDFLGATGDGSRFRIKFETVERVSETRYETRGVVQYGDEVVPMGGFIELDETFPLGEWERAADWSLPPTRDYCEWVIDEYKAGGSRPYHARALFSLSFAIFKIDGAMRSIYLVAPDGKISLEEDLRDADGWVNDMFVGELIYRTGSEPLAFGLGRVPVEGLPEDVRNLDIGAGEFWPNEKYLDMGWRSLHDLRRDPLNEDLSRREREWWKTR